MKNAKKEEKKKRKKNKNHSGIVYLATNLINNKKYVGITTRKLSTRINEHKYDSTEKSKKNKNIFS